MNTLQRKIFFSHIWFQLCSFWCLILRNKSKIFYVDYILVTKKLICQFAAFYYYFLKLCDWRTYTRWKFQTALTMDWTAYIKFDSNSQNDLSSFWWNRIAFKNLACFWTDAFWIQVQLLLSFCDPTDFLLLLKDQSRILFVAETMVMYMNVFLCQLGAC